MPIIPMLIIGLLIGGAFIYIIFEILEPKKWTKTGAVIKGALTGLGFGFVIALFWQFFLFPIWISGGDVANVFVPGFIFLALDLPVLPFYFIIGFSLGPILPFSANVEILLIHFISWILGCIFYALVFRWLGQLLQKNSGKEEEKKEAKKRPLTWEELSRK